MPNQTEVAEIYIDIPPTEARAGLPSKGVVSASLGDRLTSQGRLKTFSDILANPDLSLMKRIPMSYTDYVPWPNGRFLAHDLSEDERTLS